LRTCSGESETFRGRRPVRSDQYARLSLVATAVWLPEVGHTKGFDLAVLLELHGEIEGIVGDELKNVEAAAEVDAPA